ncbi:hypothetical protein pEaSNUABM46_00319 [Erwinia phage pEa_SNUABM_46]|nr:hypothetical protein pEaSNUABM45_00319 [Erwinia phage pEa_SNUABM_45]QYW04303.1 hypothetical protein pEaSNUABM46_00319 [Erwinia phage pEa_SNUABM_46]
MPEARKPRPADRFAKARAEKNSPERQDAAAQRTYKDTPPKSVQVKLDAVAASKKKVSRGPKASRPRQSPAVDASPKPRIRDEERVYNLVHMILSAWKADAENAAASVGIVKVSRRKIEGALRDLKNTRFTKIPGLINDVLVYNELVAEFGQWVYVEHDSPDWIFVRLPENSTPVIRADISYAKTGETSTSVSTSSEVLLKDLSEDEEDEIPENVEYDDADETDEDEEEPYDYSAWSLRDLQDYAKRYDFLQPDTEGFDDREKLIAAIELGEQH